MAELLREKMVGKKTFLLLSWTHYILQHSVSYPRGTDTYTVYQLPNVDNIFRFLIAIAFYPSSLLSVAVFPSWHHKCPTSQHILQPFHRFTYVKAQSPTILLLHLHHSSFSNPSFASPMSQALQLCHLASRPCISGRWDMNRAELILQPFRQFPYVTARSPTLPLLYLCQSSFSNPSVASPTSQLILQPFFCFSYVTGSSVKSSGEPPMYFRTLKYEQSRAHSPTFSSLPLHHSSFSNPSIALPTSKLILQPFCCFTYITVHSPTLLSLLLRHKLFT